ncbi:MAG: PQQ-binding-like beta-propeller repeat protein, partial [Candidatus Dormibacteria bacterium]
MLGSVAGWRRFSLLAGLALAVALIPGTAHAADWPTFHGDNSRQGNDSSDPGLSSPGVAWTSAQLDGQVHGQPVVVGNQVVVATENNTVYSLSAADGTVQWSTHVAGAPRTSNFACGNIRPLGITGTPVIDGGNVFVAAEVQQNPTTFIFDLVSLSLATGAVSWTHNIDPPDAQWNAVAQYQQQRGALLVTGGRVIVPLGGLDGDCGT